MNLLPWLLLICIGNEPCVAPSSFARLAECTEKGKALVEKFADIERVECRHRDVLLKTKDGRYHRLVPIR
jgi:hypothetical protein